MLYLKKDVQYNEIILLALDHEISKGTKLTPKILLYKQYALDKKSLIQS